MLLLVIVRGIGSGFVIYFLVAGCLISFFSTLLCYYEWVDYRRRFPEKVTAKVTSIRKQRYGEVIGYDLDSENCKNRFSHLVSGRFKVGDRIVAFINPETNSSILYAEMNTLPQIATFLLMTILCLVVLILYIIHLVN